METRDNDSNKEQDKNAVTRGWDIVRKFMHLQFMEISGGVTVNDAERLVKGIASFGHREKFKNSSETRKLFVDHYKGPTETTFFEIKCSGCCKEIFFFSFWLFILHFVVILIFLC